MHRVAIATPNASHELFAKLGSGWRCESFDKLYPGLRQPFGSGSLVPLLLRSGTGSRRYSSVRAFVKRARFGNARATLRVGRSLRLWVGFCVQSPKTAAERSMGFHSGRYSCALIADLKMFAG